MLGEGISIFLDNCIWNCLSISEPKVYEQYRPQWLKRLELDIYIPKLGLAFEYQGEQHYEMLNDTEFLKRFLYDIQKSLICKKRGILLVKITASALSLGSIVRSVLNGLNDFYDKTEFDSNFNRIKRKHPHYDKRIICPLPPQYYSTKHSLIHKLINSFDYYNCENKESVVDLYTDKVNLYREDINLLGLKNMSWNVGGLGPKFRKIAHKMLTEIASGKQISSQVTSMIKYGDIKEILSYAIKTDY